MLKYTVKIDGMMCGMCEAHICDAIRANLPDAKKVSASKSKGEATFVSEQPQDMEALKAAIDKTGYKFLSYTQEEYKKKGLFHR